MKKVQLLIFLCSAAISSAAWADTSLRDYFSPTERAAVKQGAIITRASLKGGDGFNLPAGRIITLPSSPHIPRALAGFEILAEERAFMPFDYTGTGRLRFYNSLFAFSRFTGIRYFSRTDKKLLTYIIDSRRIAAPGGPALGDPVYASVEPRRTGYFKVRDNRFGDIVFSHAVVSEKDGFIVASGCTHPLTRLGIIIAEKDEYRMISVFIHNAADRGFYYYGLHALRIRSGIFASSGLLNAESFANRLRAETVRRASLLGLDWNAKIRP